MLKLREVLLTEEDEDNKSSSLPIISPAPTKSHFSPLFPRTTGSLPDLLDLSPTTNQTTFDFSEALKHANGINNAKKRHRHRNAMRKHKDKSANVPSVRIFRSVDEDQDITSLEFEMLRSKQRSSSMDKLLLSRTKPQIQVESATSGPFRVESGMDCKEGEFCARNQYHVLLENPESETRWYFKYFLGKVHHNFLCYDTEKNPFFLSVIAEDEGVCRCILWKKTGNKRLVMKLSSSGKLPSPRAILEKFNITKSERTIKEISSASLQKDFLTLEEQEGSVNFKFGVVYGKAGQQGDDNLLSNRDGSESFNQFLDLIGDRIELCGWKHFRGGLDNKNNATGNESIHTVFGGHEIMFHVSTMLPYSEDNQQQLERKRHIGNDIVVIIFVDGDEEKAYESALRFYPGSIKSHFNHIFALVTHSSSTDSYRLVVHSAESVPSFGPHLPTGGNFRDPLAFREFLLTKLINGEKAAYHNHTFADKRERTLGLLLKDVEQKCTSDLRKSLGSCTQLNYSVTSPNSIRKYQELEASYTDIGQKLKVEKILSGAHPTSQRTTGRKVDPWESECITDSFPYKIVCGDVCADGTLIVATENKGTFIIYLDGSYQLIIDDKLPIANLVVAHRHQLILFRTGFTRESNYFYAVPLTLYLKESAKITCKTSLTPYQFASSKGCHYFCTSPLDEQFLRVVVAVKAKIFMMVWKYSASQPLPCDSNITECFIQHRVTTLSDVPLMMCLLDERPSGKLCLTYTKQSVVDALDEITMETQRLHFFDSVKGKMTKMLGVHQNGKSELLLGHNTSCQIVHLQDSMVFNSPEIVWNAEPNDIAYMPPYVIAFTTDTIEIRMAKNGSLIHTIKVPDLKLISQKKDLYFTSTSSLTCTNMSRQDSISKPEGKAAKVLGKSKYADCIYLYKINYEVLLGFLPSPNRSPKNSERDEETLSTCSDETETETDHLSFNVPLSDDVLTKPTLSPVPLSKKKFPLRKQMIIIPDKESQSNSVVFPESSQYNNDYSSFSPSPDSGVNIDYTMAPSPSILDSNKANSVQLLQTSSLPSLLDHTTHPPLSTS